MNKWDAFDRVAKALGYLTGRAKIPVPEVEGGAIQSFLPAYLLAARQSCILCQGEPYCVGRWTVPDSLCEEHGSIIVFALCKICWNLEGKWPLVTKELTERLTESRKEH